MKYLSVAEIAKKWGLTDRSVRKYCQDGKIPGAFLTGKTWNVPEDSEKPERAKRKSSKPQTLLDILKEQKDSKNTLYRFCRPCRSFCGCGIFPC